MLSPFVPFCSRLHLSSVSAFLKKGMLKRIGDLLPLHSRSLSASVFLIFLVLPPLVESVFCEYHERSRAMNHGSHATIPLSPLI